MVTNEKLLLTVPEAAYALNCSSQKIYNLINCGKLGYKRYGREFRICREDVDNYAKSDLRYKNQDKSGKNN